MYRRSIKYGEFSCKEWHELNGLISVVDEIREIATLVGPEYSAWVVGSILEDRDTQDLDIILTGPYRPERINFLLQEIVRMGFSRKKFIDVKYSVSGELFVPSLYNTSFGKKNFLYATYAPEIEINGKTFQYGIEKDGLWQSTQRLPLTKGYSKFDPLKLF